MDEIVVMILLLTGFCVPSASFPKVYFFVKDKMTWNQARRYCTSKYVELANIQSMDSLTAIMNTSTGGYTDKAWIGLYENATRWVWQNGLIATYSNWKTGQPDNVNATEFCVAIDTNGFWYDYSCSEVKPSVCLEDGSIYPEVIQMGMTWNDAKTNCRLNIMPLANILEDTINVIVQNALPPGIPEAWIGLSRPKVWLWSDTKEIYKFINWQLGQPDNLHGNESCATVVVKDGTWTDEQCNTAYPFFCYDIYKSRKTVVKMKIQSNANMEDPAYSTNLQQQLRAAFANKRFTDLKLTWKKLPVKEPVTENSDDKRCLSTL